MKKVFISQPFKGRTEEEVFRERDELVKIVKDTFGEEFEVIDQYHQTAPENANRFFYLSNDLLMMGEVDLIVFSPFWREANGCRIEHKLAELYDLPYIDISIKNGGSKLTVHIPHVL